MNYRTFGKTGEKVSALGFGAMRLPVVENNGKTRIDEPEAIRIIRYAIDQGVNYIDTAYPYHNGESEALVGKALQDGYREKTFLATKSPVWQIQSAKDFDNILEEQLKKLQTDHIDFYLLHALDGQRFDNTVLKYDLLSKLQKAKESGKIRYMGFSFHDNNEAFHKIVDGWNLWDFCQIQMNYIDINHQAKLEGLEYAASKGLAVIIMEPLLGGKLANLPDNVRKELSSEKSQVEWALDFLWNRPEVSLLLSGMSSFEQTKQNITYASKANIDMLSEKELEMFARAKQIFDTMALVSCTKCRYCLPCPAGLDIPGIFEAYNTTVSKGKKQAQTLYETFSVRADACKSCHKCEKVCPQHIGISKTMKEISEKLKEA